MEPELDSEYGRLMHNPLLPDLLRTGLGAYAAASGVLVPSSLTKRDSIELCTRVSLKGPLYAEREVLAPYVRRGIPARGRIDVVLSCRQTRRPFLAIEVEGRDVNPESVRNDIAKFRSLGAPFNVIVLFQVENNEVQTKRFVGGNGPVARCRALLKREGFESARVLLDSELFAPQMAERFAARMSAEYAAWRQGV